MKDRVYQVITDRVIALLEQGTVPWHKPWRGGFIRGLSEREEVAP